MNSAPERWRRNQPAAAHGAITTAECASRVEQAAAVCPSQGHTRGCLAHGAPSERLNSALA